MTKQQKLDAWSVLCEHWDLPYIRKAIDNHGGSSARKAGELNLETYTLFITLHEKLRMGYYGPRTPLKSYGSVR